MSGLRYFDDLMLATIKAEKIILAANRIAVAADEIHTNEMMANRGRMSRLAMESANEKAAAMVILRGAA